MNTAKILMKTLLRLAIFLSPGAIALWTFLALVPVLIAIFAAIGVQCVVIILEAIILITVQEWRKKRSRATDTDDQDL